MKFCFQTIDGAIRHDFSFHVRESLRYLNWRDSENASDGLHDWTHSPTPEAGYVPCGSVGFVLEGLERDCGTTPNPLNVPEPLRGPAVTGRHVKLMSDTDLEETKFVKDAEHFDGMARPAETVPVGVHQVSEIIPIDSEWRVFVFEGDRVGLQPYNGTEPFPDPVIIDGIIETYEDSGEAPVAYTLDVAVSDGDTVLIEAHDCFSVGLYGFADERILPLMFYRWYRDFIDNHGGTMPY